MAEFKGRIINKHDTEVNWLKATTFVPNIAELIVYDIDDTHDYERYKIGDGKTLVNDLPFMPDPSVVTRLDGIDNSIDDLAQKSEIPTKTSDLTNDSGFITDVPNEVYIGDGDMPDGAVLQVVIEDDDNYSNLDGVVLYSQAQTLTEEQKAQARANIGAVSVDDVLAALPKAEEASF